MCIKIYLNISWFSVFVHFEKQFSKNGLYNLMLLRCTWLLPPLSRCIWNLENQHVVVQPFVHPAMVSLASVPQQRVKYRQRRAAAKYHRPSCSRAVNDSHLVSYFFLHIHPARTHSWRTPAAARICPSSCLCSGFPSFEARVALPFSNPACHWLRIPSQLTWSSYSFILCIIFLSTYSKISISCNWKIEPLPAVGSLYSQDMFCM